MRVRCQRSYTLSAIIEPRGALRVDVRNRGSLDWLDRLDGDMLMLSDSADYDMAMGIVSSGSVLENLCRK